MIKYAQFVFFVGQERFDEVKSKLRSKFNLVDPTKPGEGHRDKLVYEENGDGVYRIDFVKASGIGFRYWGNRITSDIENRDPMLGAIKNTARLLPRTTKTEGVDLRGVVVE